jgi:UDP-N-acetylglucosamine--N-acetylmuramyl-(pentapeptide) pyrophosphoryl-undecaprenol N-acetylglucosamine transferase
METIKTICCAAGKSGGHIIPNLQWALHRKTNHKILFFSGDSSLDYHLLENNVDCHVPLHIQAPRWYQLPYFVLVLIYATLVSMKKLIAHKPIVVLSTGGIVAVPVCIAAFLLRIPIELFELNATPGSAIKWLAPLATRINVCFDSAKIHFNQKKVMKADYPIRFDSNSSSAKIFGHSNRKTIFIQGGSQGSVSLNKKIKELIEDNPQLCAQVNVIHQTGDADHHNWQQFYNQKNIQAIVFSFEDNLLPYYQEADLIICRAGTGQLFETLYFKKPCITVPLEIPGNTHQLENARAIREAYPLLFTVVRPHEKLEINF